MPKKNIKKIVIIVAIILLTIVAIFLVFSWKNNKKISSTENITLNPVEGLDLVKYPGLIQNNSIEFLNIKKFVLENTIKKINSSDKAITNIIDLNIMGINQIQYSLDGKYVYIQNEWPYDSGDYTNIIINTSNNEKYSLSANIINLDFFQNNKIIYSYYDSERDIYTLNIANIDGSNWQDYIPKDDLPTELFKISTDQKENILLIDDPHDNTNLKGMYLIDKNKKITQIANGKYIYNAKFSPDSSKIVYEVRDNNNNAMPTIYLYDMNTHTETNLNINTFVSKIAWFGENNLIVAIPEKIAEDYTSYDAYVTNDELFKIDLSGKKILQYTKEDNNFFSNIENIIITNNSQIYLLIDDNLYQIS